MGREQIENEQITSPKMFAKDQHNESLDIDTHTPDDRQSTPPVGSLTHLKFEDAIEVPIETLEKTVQTRVLRGWILLNNGITTTNFYSSWVFVMFLGFVLISFSTLEPQYINQQFGVPVENMGKITAFLYLIDYSVRMVCALMFGPMIDYYGRKFVMTIGILLLALGYLLIPFLSFNLFPGYIIGKSFISAGLISISMLPFSADYVDDSTKGVMTGMNYGIGFIGGAICGILIKCLLLLGFSYKFIYWIYCPIVLVVGFSIRPGIKGGNTYYKNKKIDVDEKVKDGAIQWKAIKKAYKEIPWISISVIFGVLGNTDFYIMTTALMIWIKTLIPADEDPTVIATTYQVLFFSLSVLTTIFAALKIDKIPHMRIIFPVLIVALCGFVMVPFASDPRGFLLHLFFIIEGLSLPGVFVFSTYLAIRYNPAEIRGSLSAISNSISFLAAIIILCVGGYLHDHWRSDASFILYGGLLLFTLFLVTFIYFRTLKYSAKPNDTEMIKLAQAS